MIEWRPADHASWESEDWRWNIVSRPVNYPDNGGPRTYSVRDMTVQEWVDQDFDTFEAAAAYCEGIDAADRDELRQGLGL